MLLSCVYAIDSSDDKVRTNACIYSSCNNPLKDVAVCVLELPSQYPGNYEYILCISLTHTYMYVHVLYVVRFQCRQRI